MLRGLCGALALLSAESAFGNVQIVDTSRTPVFLAAGEQTIVEFSLRNNSAQDEVADLLSLLSVFPPQAYAVTALSTCPVAGFPGAAVLVSAGSTVECRYAVMRQPTATMDITLSFLIQRGGQTASSKVYLIGDLTAVRVLPSWVQFPSAGNPARMTLLVHNEGPTAIGSVSYATCVYPSGHGSMIRVIGGDCVPAGALCFTGGLDHGFAMTDIPVGGSKSCLVEWDSDGATGLHLPLDDLRKLTPAGARLININRASDEILVSGVSVPVTLPTQRPLGLLALLGLMVCFGGAVLLRKE